MPISIYTCIYRDDIENLKKLINSDRTCLELVEGDLGGTPLIFACLSFKLEAVRILLEEGADIYGIDIWRNNALHCVVSTLKVASITDCKKIETLWAIAKLLLERETLSINEDCAPVTLLIESKNNLGLTPLDMAVPKPEMHARLLRLIDEVADEFEKRDDSKLFSQPQLAPAVESKGWFARLFHRHKRLPMKLEEETLLVSCEPISVGGASKPKVE